MKPNSARITDSGFLQIVLLWICVLMGFVCVPARAQTTESSLPDLGNIKKMNGRVTSVSYKGRKSLLLVGNDPYSYSVPFGRSLAILPDADQADCTIEVDIAVATPVGDFAPLGGIAFRVASDGSRSEVFFLSPSCRLRSR